MKLFGPGKWGNPELGRIEVPVGEPCTHCEEKIKENELGVLFDGNIKQYMHRECFLREILGSVAHQKQRCRCFRGPDAEEEVGMTKRQSAIAAAEYADREMMEKQAQ